jgi:nucleotide-binding universal stress UspA family protein
MHIRTILCPIDFEKEPRCGLQLPVSIAERFGAKLVFCHVTDVRKVALRETEKRLEEYVDRQFAGLGVPGLKDFITYEEYVVDSPNVSRGISDLAADLGAELIVMCSSHSPTGYSFLSSTSERVCRSAPCAVLMIDPMSQNLDFKGFQRLVVAYDFSLHSELALQYGLRFATAFASDLNVMHVLPEQGPVHYDTVEVSPYHETMKRLRATVPTGTGSIQSSLTIKWGRPYREILNHAAETDADLILMGAQGSDFGLRALFGSNVDRVVRQAGRMVLIAHPLKPAMRVRQESGNFIRELDPLGSHG